LKAATKEKQMFLMPCEALQDMDLTSFLQSLRLYWQKSARNA